MENSLWNHYVTVSFHRDCFWEGRTCFCVNTMNECEKLKWTGDYYTFLPEVLQWNFLLLGQNKLNQNFYFDQSTFLLSVFSTSVQGASAGFVVVELQWEELQTQTTSKIVKKKPNNRGTWWTHEGGSTPWESKWFIGFWRWKQIIEYSLVSRPRPRPRRSYGSRPRSKPRPTPEPRSRDWDPNPDLDPEPDPDPASPGVWRSWWTWAGWPGRWLHWTGFQINTPVWCHQGSELQSVEQETLRNRKWSGLTSSSFTERAVQRAVVTFHQWTRSRTNKAPAGDARNDEEP